MLIYVDIGAKGNEYFKRSSFSTSVVYFVSYLAKQSASTTQSKVKYFKDRLFQTSGLAKIAKAFRGKPFCLLGGTQSIPPPPHGPLTAIAKVLTLLDCDLSLQNSILNSKTDLNKIISIKPASVSIFPVFVLCLTFGLSLNNQLKKSSGKSWIGQEFEV